MKELISFSLRRRFFNGATILLNVMLCIVACGILFFDKIVDFINPSMFDDQRIYLNLDEIEEDILLNMEMSGVELIVDDRDYQSLIQESPKAYVLYFDDGYKVASQYKIDSNLIDILRGMLQEVHQTMTLSSTLTLEEYEILNQQLDLENIILQEDVSMDQQKENIVFMVITSIYFTMLSFSTSVANEVIYEKSTRQLELILTSVSSKVHFYSKMVVGWLGILIQAIGVVCYVVVATLLRIMFDEGKDLIQFVNKIHLMSIKEDTILKFLSNISIDFDFMSKLFFIFFFLMMGILLLQMVLVVLSSFISNIEEAGNVQGPFYMLLMAVYYLAISLNTPYQMSEGIGYILSFFPFLSMLFMPCRLLIQNVSILELGLSALISLVFMYLVVSQGSIIYQRGVLDYTSKGFIDIMKKMFIREKTIENVKK